MLQPDSSETREVQQRQNKNLTVELKGAVFTHTLLRLHSFNFDAVSQILRAEIARMPRFFENAPVVLDLEILRGKAGDLEFPAMISLLKSLKLLPIGVCNGRSEQNKAALQAGLAVMRGRAINQDIAATREKLAKQPSDEAIIGSETTPVEGISASIDNERPTTPTKVVHQPIRSGQQIYARGGDLILLAAVNAGAEVLADGNIHAYAPLRGRALAGVSGDAQARIFCQAVEAELLAIAGNYRVFDEKIRIKSHQKPSQIYLDNDQLIVETL